VPAEANRLNRRLRARDRVFLAAIACALVLLVPLGILLAERNSNAPAGHCVTELRASIMGGATFKFCGAKADAECARAAASDSSLAAQCRRIGDS